jgi:2-polyprenyl-3-methyl-5-hydroxy-6-metoxy-1,4-benzoquinol methylase
MIVHLTSFHNNFVIISSDFLTSNRAGFVRTLLHSFQTRFSSQSDFDINGSLDIYPLHLFSMIQLKKILKTGKKNSLFQDERLNELFNNQSINECTSNKDGIVDTDSGPGPGLKSRYSNIDKIRYNALDIGAGVGLVTDVLKDACKDIIVTETSSVMSNRLRLKGYKCWNEDITLTYKDRIEEGYTFDLISMLNVIDRTPRPSSLLSAVHSLLKPNGMILIATPLPFRPFYFTSDHMDKINVNDNTNYEEKRNYKISSNVNDNINNMYSKKIDENKNNTIDNNIKNRQEKPIEDFCFSTDDCWEKQAEIFITEILPKHGFRCTGFSRLPYISAGDFFTECWILDDIVLTAEKI